ncbi:hypothetical protein QWZ06_07625 [Chryseobacterium tructae]|uniref:Bacteriocin n=1 Tax=Chryseobacterium tructae TaxID=1037380 RepID=A0ABV7XV99_9FLAO|nr:MULTISPECIES: hypothetical protein [Chryseobacterium]MDN3692138.1 hypothetical protein [Chryseobacterium tructae]
MKKTNKNSKKIDLNSLKVINKENLNSIHGGGRELSLEQSAWSSLVSDNDNTDTFSSLFSDIEK